jgi:hypothetical protein
MRIMLTPNPHELATDKHTSARARQIGAVAIPSVFVGVAEKIGSFARRGIDRVLGKLANGLDVVFDAKKHARCARILKSIGTNA